MSVFPGIVAGAEVACFGISYQEPAGPLVANPAGFFDRDGTAVLNVIIAAA